MNWLALWCCAAPAAMLAAGLAWGRHWGQDTPPRPAQPPLRPAQAPARPQGENPYGAIPWRNPAAQLAAGERLADTGRPPAAVPWADRRAIGAPPR